MEVEAAGNPAHSPESGAETSFPERHFTPCPDGKPLFSGIAPDAASPVDNRQIFETTFPSQSWPSDGQSLLDHRHPSLHSPELSINKPSGIPFPPTSTPLAQPEWPLFHQRCRGGVFWQHVTPEFTVEDESDCNQSPSNSLEESSFSDPFWPAPGYSRQRGGHGSSKLTPTPVSISHSTSHSMPHSARPYSLDLDHNLEQTEPSDAATAFSPPPNINQADHSRHHIDVTFHNHPSTAKVDSKRIAHKLSEKTRRNRLTIAIREIQKLLPAEIDAEELPSAQEADFVVRPGVPSSKLDIVEMAVGFIKDLKERNKEMGRRLLEVERRLARCQCQDEGENCG